MIEYIKSFFKGKQEEKLLKKKYNSDNMNEKRFLLCLDNAENAIEKDNDEFTKFLAELYDECDNLCVLITTNRVLGELANNHKPTTFFVKWLHMHSAVELFLDNCGEISDEDLIMFLLAD